MSLSYSRDLRNDESVYFFRIIIVSIFNFEFKSYQRHWQSCSTILISFYESSFFTYDENFRSKGQRFGDTVLFFVRHTVSIETHQ